MDRENKSLADTPRKLLLGELVEVLQKELGLRGSWHPAKVVRVKHGRRVVEYDGLLTPDQSRNLRESVHFSSDIKLHSANVRLKNGTKTKLEKRGFIRPRPPPRATLPPRNWKQGLMVDAFYDDAWWEGILLDDVHSCHADSKFKVFFPEEGDELRMLIKDLRVSQEWDEDSGQWAMCGHWSLLNEKGKIDLSSLKDICKTSRSFSKKLWRQRSFNGYQVLQVEEQRVSQALCTSIAQKQLNSLVVDGEIACQGTKTFAHEVTTWQEEATTNQLSFHSLNTVVRAGFEGRYGDAAAEAVIVAADERLSVGNLELPRQEADEVQFVGKLKGKKNFMKKVKDRLAADNSRGSSRSTRNSSTSILVNQESDKRSLSKLREAANGSLRYSLEDNDLPQEETRRPGCSAENPQLSKSNDANDVHSNGEQTDSKSNGLLPCKRGSWYHSMCVQDKDLSGKEIVFANCSIPQKVRIRQARLAAKQYLLNAGWTFDVRNRARGHLIKQEVVYVSPSGSRFFSLAAACRGWKSRESPDVFLGSSIDKEIELLSVYCMAGDMNLEEKLEGRSGTVQRAEDDTKRMICSQKLSKVQEKAEQMLSAGLGEGEGKASLSLADCQVSGLVNTAINIVDRKSVDPSSSTSIQGSDCALGDVIVKKKKLRQNGESQKKRKSEVLDGLSLLEMRRKRGRPSLKRGGCRMQVLLSCPGKDKDLDLSKNAGDSFQFKKSTVLSWLMDKGILKENEPVAYINRKDGHVMKKGRVTREGVICVCCNEVFTLSNFEAHAGSKLHRPSANTFLDDGRSISDCQLEACAFQDVKEKESLLDINDDTCGVCGDGGELVLCDHCPSTFHAECIGLEIIPEGDWYCPRCCCGICGSNQFSAHDIDDSVHRCGQCELEYHLICAQEHTLLAIPGAEASTWFCDPTCKEIFTALRALVGIANPMENGFSWTLLRSMKKDKGLSPSSLEEMAEHHSKLSVAHGVMQECFVPMIDPRTNINLLSQAIYNRRSKVTRLNYSGFYTMLLERGDEIISVATIRVHGARLAEMPLVGTRYQYRRQGMCRRLMHALEEMLRGIGVEKLILPAVPELLDTWMGAFKFMKLSPQETRELSKLSLMTFPGTTLLQKYLPTGTHTNRSAYFSHLLGKIDDIESPPCKSVEDFLTMARASLDSSVLNRRKAFITGEVNKSGQVSSGLSVHSFLSADPQTPVTLGASKGCSHIFSNVGKLKSRIKRRDHLESSGDGLMTSKVQEDDDLYTSVVIATTRSNRLVKSRRWIADGLKELKNTKQPKRSFSIPDTFSDPAVDSSCNRLFETLLHSDIGQDGQNAETVYVRRRRTPMPVKGNEAETGQGKDLQHSSVVDSSHQDFFKVELGVQRSGSSLGQHDKSMDCTKWDEDSFSGYYSVDSLSMDPASFNLHFEDELSICPKFYRRRKKRESILTDSTTDIVEKVTAEQSTKEVTLCAEGSHGPRTNLESPSVLHEGVVS